MVCVAGEGQGTIELVDCTEGADESQMKILKISQSTRVTEVVSRVSQLFQYEVGSVNLILKSDREKVDLMYVQISHPDITMAEIGVDFTSETTYRLYITERPSSPPEGDEEKMACVDGGGSSILIMIVDLTGSDVLLSTRYTLKIDLAMSIADLFRLIENDHEPGTFDLLLQCGRKKIELNDNDTRKLSEVCLDDICKMLLITDPADSSPTTPPTETERIVTDSNCRYVRPYTVLKVSELKPVRRKTNREYNRTMGKVDSERIEEQDVERNRGNEYVYVGLVNQAMTCYLNSLIQALYMTPEFRNALYNWEYVNGTDKEEQTARYATSIPYQLQKLFLNLQTSSKHAIETTSLTKSFGWDSTQAWQQHDIQELCRVMFDALEQKFKNTEQADLINRLYEGKMIDYVKCLECSTEKSREDTFLDIPLPVRPFGSNVAYNSVEEALNAFVQPETLDGTNQYHCETCNKKCDAHKGLKFTKFPYLLTLHLKRFDFDYNTFHRIKLNDEVTFPDILNLNSLIPPTDNQDSPCNEKDTTVEVKCEEGLRMDSVPLIEKCPPSDNGMSVSDHSTNHDLDDDSEIDLGNGPLTSSTLIHDNEKNRGDKAEPKGPYMYELFSIMIHSGSASGGHYYAYIKDFRTGEWLCFNDQNVSPITYDDIQKTYGGGPTRAYYSGVYSSSTNAYMLMYRQIDEERNALPMQVKDFPKHLQELLVTMQENQDNQDTTYRKSFKWTEPMKVCCFRPNEKTMAYVKLACHYDSTFAEFTDHAYRRLHIEKIVPRDQVRLVAYQEYSKLVQCSFEGREEETLRSVLDDQRVFLLEIREKNEKFKPYMACGVTLEVLVVDVAKKEVVKGPIAVRGGLTTQTVGEFKHELSKVIDMEPKDINLIGQFSNEPAARLIRKNDNLLMEEDFASANKFFVPTFFDSSTTKSIADGLHAITEIFFNLISVNIYMADTSEEILRELNIPSLEDKTKEKAEEAPLTNGPTKVTPVIDGPTDSEKSEANEKREATKSAGSDELSIAWHKDTSSPPTRFENEEWHTPEQSNSEDSSLSYSDRTLVGEGDASEDDDYPLVNVDHELFHRTEQENWDIEDPSEYYLRVTSHPNKELRVLVDKRMTLEMLKKLLEPWVGVPMEYYKISRHFDSDIECGRLAAPLSFHKDGEILYLKLGRALRSGEFQVKLYQLLLDNDNDPYKYLCKWIISKDATVGQTKKEILAELKKKYDIDIPFERCRLRKKNQKIADRVFLDDQKFKDISFNWPFEIIVQELPGKDPVTDQNDVVIFARRMPMSGGWFGIQELIVSGKTIAEVREKISGISGIPEEYLEMAKGKSALPNDLGDLLLQGYLDWNRQSTTPANCPEITLENGFVIYYRDWRENDILGAEDKTEKPIVFHSDEYSHAFNAEDKTENVLDYKTSKSRMLRISPSPRYSPRRERALKIYIDDK